MNKIKSKRNYPINPIASPKSGLNSNSAVSLYYEKTAENSKTGVKKHSIISINIPSQVSTPSAGKVKSTNTLTKDELKNEIRKSHWYSILFNILSIIISPVLSVLKTLFIHPPP